MLFDLLYKNGKKLGVKYEKIYVLIGVEYEECDLTTTKLKQNLNILIWTKRKKGVINKMHRNKNKSYQLAIIIIVIK